MPRLPKITWVPLILSALTSEGGCASPVQQTVLPATAAREEFDPQVLKDDDFLLRPTDGEAPPVSPSTPVVPPGPGGLVERVDGFRLQIAAVLDRERAAVLQEQAGKQFEAPVHVKYDEDTRLYKIQVGDGRTAREVEALRSLARSHGYREAFVVRAKIAVARTPIRRPSKIGGYRIQIFSASSQRAAEQAQAGARVRLDRSDVYIEFKPPYFKVRVGNFRTRKTAEAYLETAKDLGYDTPFPVETQILAVPE